jgi:hypothetical protein
VTFDNAFAARTPPELNTSVSIPAFACTVSAEVNSLAAKTN